MWMGERHKRKARRASGRAVNMSGETVDLDTPAVREMARIFKVPDAWVGIPTPWRRRLWQRYVSRRL